MKNFIIFTVGFATGIVAGGYVFKKRYEEIMEEDRQSRNAAYNHKIEDDSSVDTEESDSDMSGYEEVISKSGYSENTEQSEGDEPEFEIIKAYEFDTIDDYSSVTLTLYSNDIVCDDSYEPLSEDEIVAAVGGREVFKHFGEYDPDTIYVRNNEKKIDYEILRDEEEYEE